MDKHTRTHSLLRGDVCLSWSWRSFYFFPVNLLFGRDFTLSHSNNIEIAHQKFSNWCFGAVAVFEAKKSHEISYPLQVLIIHFIAHNVNMYTFRYLANTKILWNKSLRSENSILITLKLVKNKSGWYYIFIDNPVQFQLHKIACPMISCTALLELTPSASWLVQSILFSLFIVSY